MSSFLTMFFAFIFLGSFHLEVEFSSCAFCLFLLGFCDTRCPLFCVVFYALCRVLCVLSSVFVHFPVFNGCGKGTYSVQKLQTEI